jgi:hypothetical protein
MRNFYEDMGPEGVKRMLVSQSFPMNVTYVVLIVLFVLGCVSIAASVSLSSELVKKTSPNKEKAVPDEPKTSNEHAGDGN